MVSENCPGWKSALLAGAGGFQGHFIILFRRDLRPKKRLAERRWLRVD
jgi:hypothetical protein